uniref:uncharacterized protein LOC101313355 n=1 Tax=Fragaria vesca subsp. vesca TaxID=101020 RepID=UPI0005CAD84F|nr:PREDICTED: uncharacterized protein LOC101313355 [Fragaria vesca subsp. vesca]
MSILRSRILSSVKGVEVDLKIRPELFNKPSKRTYFGECSCHFRVPRYHWVEDEPGLIEAVRDDNKSNLVTQMELLTARVSPDQRTRTASKLLHLCCKFDSHNCASAILDGELGAVPLVNECDDYSGKSPLHTAASAHASRCVEVLLDKQARTDLRTRDGQAQLALQLCLTTDTRIDLNRNPDDFSVQELLIHISEKQLRTVKLLSEKTKEIADVAYAYAVKGRVASLTALLIVAADKLIDSVVEWPDSKSQFKEKLTIYECLIRKALTLGGRATPPLRAAKRASTATEGENSERRKLLLREIELLQLFGAVAQKNGGGDNNLTPPLIRAAQGGDEAVVQLLLRSKIDVNEADAQGNTAVHCILKSRLLCPQQIRILWLLLEHGALPCQRNKLGETPFHIAAGNGNSEALQVLLLEDPVGVLYKTEMKETPLFFAVKNESKECAKLLLTWGANSEVRNLRRQRAIDLATSLDMRYILLNPTTVSLINHAFPKESRKVKEGVDHSYCFVTKLLKHKVFVGGLPPSVDSDDLRKFCEQEFGSVEDAIVIVTETENKIQSRGFGFVTFGQEKSASEAMQAHYFTMGGKTVEIKSLIPKLVLEAEFEKMSPQREQEQNFQFLQQKSNESIMEGDNPEQDSWADRLVHRQPTVCSTEPQVTKSSQDPSTPTWRKVFNKWFPGFLQGLSKHSDYALSSLKVDFTAKFGLKLDHSSVGFSKLSDFLMYPPDLCTIKRRTPNHMILQPKFSSHTLSLSLYIVNSGDSRCLSDVLSGGGGHSKDLQNFSVDSGNDDEKCLQDLPGDNAIATKSLHDLSLDFKSCKVKGTTNVAWVSEDFIALAVDSRGTCGTELVGDTYPKIQKVSPYVLSTMVGDSEQVRKTIQHMINTIDEKTANGTDPECVKKVGRAGCSTNRDPNAAGSMCFIAGVQSQAPRCYLLYDLQKTDKVRDCALDDVLTWKAIGSGATFAAYVVERMWRKYPDGRASIEDVVQILLYAMLTSTLRDYATGGILTGISHP